MTLGRPPKPPGSHRVQIRGSLSPDAAAALVALVSNGAYSVAVGPELRAEIADLLAPIKAARTNAARRARRAAS